MTKDQELQAAIVKAVPDLLVHPSFKGEWEECTVCGVIREKWKEYPCERPITLEDVLRAISRLDDEPQAKQWGVISSGKAVCFRHGFFYAWQLGKPLSEQSEETKAFLHSLLV